jgi:hypothetical protein
MKAIESSRHQEHNMRGQQKIGFLILDRKGEYIEDTIDQRSNTVFGLAHHPNARDCMVVVSNRPDFAKMCAAGRIYKHLPARFSIKDIEPIDLADFLIGLTPQQAELVRQYAYIDGFYEKLLAETVFGAVDNRDWFKHFPGLFDLKDKGKKLIREFEGKAASEKREELTAEELEGLQEHLGGTKPGVLERAAGTIKRFCLNPFFGASARGKTILATKSGVEEILQHLEQGRFVFIDMRGQSDEDYTMVTALFARQLLRQNKKRKDAEQIRACIVMEEAHNILSEDDLSKGEGRGSVFVELAREGRSFKLGFILVTQQPDPQSIAPQVVKTIDTVIAFNMPPDDAKHLQRLKSGFTGLELSISNAGEFEGVAIADAGPVFFVSGPTTTTEMAAAATGSLAASFVESLSGDTTEADLDLGPQIPVLTLEDRIALLNRRRQESIQPVALATMQRWRGDGAKTAPSSDGVE